MTSREFMDYLFDELMSLGERICEKCIYNRNDGEHCESYKNGLVTHICVDGVRAYVEADKKQK